MSSGLLSTSIVTVVGLACKATLNIGFCSVTVNGLHNLTDALANDNRDHGQGILTVSNHISTLDDPVTWGVLPARCYLSSRSTRWSLGASDIIFTNPLFSTFFRLGQTLETFRGKGVHQLAVDTAIQKLDKGDWVHLYCEGKVNQSKSYPRDGSGIAHLPMFRWGVGRILMETSKLPVIIPMWLSGFDKLMPEGRNSPYKYFPRPGAQLGVTFGSPVPLDEIQEVLSSPENTRGSKALKAKPLPTSRSPETEEQGLLKIRASITAIVQRKVESLEPATPAMLE